MRFETFERRHIAEVVRLCVTEGWTSYTETDTARRALTAPGSIVLVAVEDPGTVVGFVQLQGDGMVHAHVSIILIAASHRRRGIGRRLLEQAFARSGARYVDLVSTEGADGFYRSFDHREYPGFRLHPTAVEHGGPREHVGEDPGFDGCVISDSLRDPTLINRLRVWRAWVAPHELLSDDHGTMARWHIYWISCSAADVDRIQAGLKPWRWYAHFWRDDQMVVVYHDARFDMRRADRSTWAPAIAHGRAKGIPEEQLDFLILRHDD